MEWWRVSTIRLTKLLNKDWISAMWESTVLLFEFHNHRKLFYIILINMQISNPATLFKNNTVLNFISECYHEGKHHFCKLALDFIPKGALTSYDEFHFPLRMVLVQAGLTKNVLLYVLANSIELRPAGFSSDFKC